MNLKSASTTPHTIKLDNFSTMKGSIRIISSIRVNMVTREINTIITNTTPTTPTTPTNTETNMEINMAITTAINTIILIRTLILTRTLTKINTMGSLFIVILSSIINLHQISMVLLSLIHRTIWVDTSRIITGIRQVFYWFKGS